MRRTTRIAAIFLGLAVLLGMACAKPAPQAAESTPPPATVTAQPSTPAPTDTPRTVELTVPPTPAPTDEPTAEPTQAPTDLAPTPAPAAGLSSSSWFVPAAAALAVLGLLAFVLVKRKRS